MPLPSLCSLHCTSLLHSSCSRHRNPTENSTARATFPQGCGCSKVLSRFPNLLTLETTVPINQTNLKFIAETCPLLEVINLNTEDSPQPETDSEDGMSVLANGCPKLSRVLFRWRRSFVSAHLVKFLNLARNLTHLDLGHWSVSDQALEAIGSFSSISYLNLKGCYLITDGGLGFLANGSCSKTLKTLILAWCIMITDIGVSHLHKMRCLEYLNMASLSEVTDIGGVAISKIGTLKKLNLRWLGKISDRTIAALAENCVNLEVLNLSRCCKVTGAGIRAFSSYMCLESLALIFCEYAMRVSDVEHVVLGCPALKSIVFKSQRMKCTLPFIRNIM